MSSRRVATLTRHLTAGGQQQKVAIVVGVGPRKGLGGAAAARLAKEGYHVFIMGRTLGRMQETVDSIEHDGAGKCTAVVMKSIGASTGFDVAAYDSSLMETEVIACFDAACAAGKLDIVIQNQGPNMPPPTGADMRNMTPAFVEYMW
jgi:NAD(P)-dependent dehydrogenase (short-subunit alcohol dehydrogenase family)